MIDLKNTYIENDKGELRALYVKECAKQGVFIYGDYSENWLDMSCVYILGNYVSTGEKQDCCVKQITLADLKPMKSQLELVDGCEYSFYTDGAAFIGIFKLCRNAFFTTDGGNKICGRNRARDVKLKSDPELTSNKTRVKAEYVECCNLQTALDEFVSMAGIEFYCSKNGVGRINSVKSLALAYGQSSLYRKTEREFTWQDEVKEFFRVYDVKTVNDFIDFKNDNGNTSMQDDFIKMCSRVHNATKGE